MFVAHVKYIDSDELVSRWVSFALQHLYNYTKQRQTSGNSVCVCVCVCVFEILGHLMVLVE